MLDETLILSKKLKKKTSKSKNVTRAMLIVSYFLFSISQKHFILCKTKTYFYTNPFK